MGFHSRSTLFVTQLDLQDTSTKRIYQVCAFARAGNDAARAFCSRHERQKSRSSAVVDPGDCQLSSLSRGSIEQSRVFGIVNVVDARSRGD